MGALASITALPASPPLIALKTLSGSTPAFWALLVLLVTSVFVYLGLIEAGWMWAGSIGAAFVVWLVRPLMPGQDRRNRRVPLIGSRFSPPQPAISHQPSAEPGGHT